MKPRIYRIASGILIGAVVLVARLGAGQTFPAPIAQAVALLTSGTTPFAIVGVNASGYMNFGTARSASGYGLRDNAGVIEAKNSGGSWGSVLSGGGAPTSATYITQTPNGSLSAEQALSTLASAILVNTTSTGVVSAYTGTTCTNQFPRALSALGVATCASVSLTADVTGTVGAANGGTGNATYAIGDLLQATAATTLSRLAAVATGNVLISGGVTTASSWGKVGLTTHVSGILPVANGGSGLTAGTSGGVLGYTAAGTLASSVVLTASRLVLGGGAGATPTVLGSLGTTVTVLHGNAAGAPTFGAVNLATDTTGSIGVAQGGTGIASYAIGDMLYATGATTLAALADVSAGSFLRSGGVTTAPAWSTTKWPNSATTGDVLIASGTNQYANLADVAAGAFLRSGGVTTAPVWSTTTWPNSATIGDLIAASGTSAYANIAAVGTGRVLGSMGVGTLPAWLTNPSATTFEVSTAFLGPGTEAAAGVVRLANTSLIAARNAGDTGDITLITSLASDRIQVGSANATGLSLILGTKTLSMYAGVPTISSGFGTTPAIAGSAADFTVTVGGGGDTSGVVLFNVTWPAAPNCMTNDHTTTQTIRATATTTQITLTGTMSAADSVGVHCWVVQ